MKINGFANYVTQKDGKLFLTPKAKQNLSRCVINIREQNFVSYANTYKDLLGYAVLGPMSRFNTN